VTKALFVGPTLGFFEELLAHPAEATRRAAPRPKQIVLEICIDHCPPIDAVARQDSLGKIAEAEKPPLLLWGGSHC
jgi:hypothetical protein